MFIFVILGLLVCIKAQGSVTPVFVQTGHDLRLDLKEPVTLQKNHDITWRVNGSTNIIKLVFGSEPGPFKVYELRAELFAHNYSLLLKNVKQNDSGVYRARLSAESLIYKAEYEVTVKDPVSPVTLTEKNCSRDSSNLTVTCSTLDSLISTTFTCDDQTCSHESGQLSEVTPSAASFRVYLKNGHVICNHSNQVSWTQDTKRIEDFCIHAGSESVSAGISVCLVKTAVFSGGLVIMVSAVITVHVIEKLKKKN